ncbi:hypothetical protein FGO68_gene16612 [Halteria grandinella]|uniref:Uncharacterized protein n=1 Tax=Halteria grandinella TaxID=5974 RepID=A0A8J8N9M4_HALGN|nr:hypothetical protein FGO68_gene16612 [Halteria grandinella]
MIIQRLLAHNTNLEQELQSIMKQKEQSALKTDRQRLISKNLLSGLLDSIEVDSTNHNMKHRYRHPIRQQKGKKQDAMTDTNADEKSYGPWQDDEEYPMEQENAHSPQPRKHVTISTEKLIKGHDFDKERYILGAVGISKKHLFEKQQSMNILKSVAQESERKRIVDKYMTPRLPEITEAQYRESIYNDDFVELELDKEEQMPIVPQVNIKHSPLNGKKRSIKTNADKAVENYYLKEGYE